MTQPPALDPIPPDAASRLVALLEHHGEHYPFIAEELRRHQTLTEAMAAQRGRAEHALLAWQAALARRWACEVAAQRVYRAVQGQLDAYQREDQPIASPLLALVHSGAANTPGALLHEVRRLAATLELLSPRPPFANEGQTRLQAVGEQLEAAIAETESCEAERRSLISEQRVVANLLALSQERARQLLVRHALVGEQP